MQPARRWTPRRSGGASPLQTSRQPVAQSPRGASQGRLVTLGSSSRGHSAPPGLIAQAASDTLAWIGRVELLIAEKQRHYLSRMRELELEKMLPIGQRCPLRQARVRTLAGKQLDDIRELLELLRDTLDQLPPQLRGAAPAAALASASEGALAGAVALVEDLPRLSGGAEGDCPVCLSDLCHAGADVVALPCGGGVHCFHRPCIRNWATVSARCPLCRSVFGCEAAASIWETAAPVLDQLLDELSEASSAYPSPAASLSFAAVLGAASVAPLVTRTAAARRGAPRPGEAGWSLLPSGTDHGGGSAAIAEQRGAFNGRVSSPAVAAAAVAAVAAARPPRRAISEQPSGRGCSDSPVLRGVGISIVGREVVLERSKPPRAHSRPPRPVATRHHGTLLVGDSRRAPKPSAAAVAARPPWLERRTS